MAIFDFVKEAGEALFHGRLGQPSSTSPQSATSPPSGTTEQFAQKLGEYLQKLNLGIENPQVKVEGDKAVVQGKAQSQEAMEKAILAIGNTQGISKVESKIDAPANANEPKFITVKPGDTLSKIAKEVLGDANKYQIIFEANKPMLKNPDHIFPGQKLRIPQETNKAA
jgi:nucleoid-associated protein YgaU